MIVNGVNGPISIDTPDWDWEYSTGVPYYYNGAFNKNNPLQNNTPVDDADWNKFLGYANIGLNAIGKLGGLWGGYNQLKLAKDQLALDKEAFNFNKNATITNFNNNVNAQNEAYRQQSAAKYSQEGLTGSALDNAIAQRQNNLSLRSL